MLPMRHPRRELLRRDAEADAAELFARWQPQPLHPRRWLPEPEAVWLAGLHRERHIALGADAELDSADLIRARKTKTRPCSSRQSRDIAPGKQDSTGDRCKLASELADQGG